jgi:L-amino acid N-acyltransferase YncA
VAVTVRTMTAHEAKDVLAIFAEGIATGNATLETDVPEWAAWDASHLASCRYVAVDPRGAVLGWAALSPVSGRCVYRGVAEISVYVRADARSRGVGKLLLDALVRGSEAYGLWTLQAAVLPENEASLALHRACGFREIGRCEKLGMLRGVWRDVVLLERRSSVVGT